MLEEKISKNLGVPYIYIPSQKKFLCSNGVLFTMEEYKSGIDLNVEYERKEKEDKLYDYAYAKSTGLLRKKRTPKENQVLPFENKDIEVEQKTIEECKPTKIDKHSTDSNKSVLVISALLAFTSVISMYISTLHTATYLFDYVDMLSAWLMSASVTAYNSTAFEVSVLFHTKKRNLMASIFMLLWILVTLFSMVTTISVFYDRFNFTETQIQEENKVYDSNKLSLELLQKKEKDLRESIEFKKKDIEYRQEKEFATTAVRNELNKLQEDLQKNLSEQQKIINETPEITEKTVKRKESLFNFLGRMLGIEGSVLEFIISTLSAIFINLIAPLSLTAVTELLKKKEINI